MAHGLNSVLRRGPAAVGCKSEGKSGIGSRRIFAPHFKLQVLDSYRNDADCKGNQRATARKYGIHRRQIQKWLQCENNLRNSVGKGKAVSLDTRKCGTELSLRSGQHRQRDDSCADAYCQNVPEHETQIRCSDMYLQNTSEQDVLNGSNVIEEARVPLLTVAPLDYTVHSRSHAASPIDFGAPMDLSFKRTTALGDVSAPVCCPLSPRTSLPANIPSPSSLVPLIQQPHPDIWDLSIRNQNREISNSPIHSPNVMPPVTENQPKPVKLFKPYLDDINENCQEDKTKLAEVTIPPCCNRFISTLPENESHFYNNNHISQDYTYTLHELQPKNTINYYYTINKNYMYPSDCESLPFCVGYENARILQHTPPPPLKQRQSYSLDFKLRAIECYYQDSMCKGNQRAVATKYNIHRRQVQKWLKQEDELRNRNETSKYMNVVR